MKKLTVAVLGIVFILVGCAKSSDIDGLQSQIDELKSDKIATIQSQITNINNSITSLQTVDRELRGYIETLQKQYGELKKADDELVAEIAGVESALDVKIDVTKADIIAQLEAYQELVSQQMLDLNSAVNSLQIMDENLQSQISDLRTYSDNGLKNTQDWANATFVTLTEYNNTANAVAVIQAQIIAINEQMEELRKVTGVTKKELDDAISGLDASLRESISKILEECNTSIGKVSEEITAAYSKAIADAVSASETSMKRWINEQLTGYYTIAQTDAKIASLKSSLESQLTSQKAYLEGLVSNLETSLTSKIEGNKTLIDGLQEQINGLSGDLSELAGSVGSNSVAISNNAKEILANAKAIAANSTAIGNNAADIEACEKLIAANKKLIEANDAAIKENQTAITKLQERVTQDEQSIYENASDIARNAADISANAALIAANATAISNNAKAISDNAADIIQMRADMEKAKTELTEAYNKAIQTAINTLDGKLSGQIAKEVETLNSRIDSEIQAVNTAIDALAARVTTCEKDIKSIKNTIYIIQQDIEEIQDQIKDIMARIQTITYVPKYSDERAVMTYTDNGTIMGGTAEFVFEMKPVSTASELAKVWKDAVSMEAVYTIVKGAPEMVKLDVESVTADKGFITVIVSGKALKDEYFLNQCGANVRLSISDGNNDITTDYIQMIPWTTDVINFADANFKAYCVENFDTSGDGELTEEEAQAATAINASMLGITSLVGIGYFSNLTSIDVSFNKLASIDLTHSPNLETIDVSGNRIQSLDIKGLSKITGLDCSNNKLSSIDVSDAAGLKTLYCSNNELGSILLSNNKDLTELECNNNKIAVLDLKNNTKLEILHCRKNSISVIDVTKMAGLRNLDCSANTITALNLYQNPELDVLYCSSNSLTSLGITANTKLTVLDCSKNALTALDVAKNTVLETIDCSDNNLERLDVSLNSALESLSCTGNTAMTKLWVKNASQQAALTIKKDDATMIAFNDGGIYIPDVNLKSYLVTNFDEDGDGEISIMESEFITNLNCSGKGIADLTGLECCTNLVYVNCSGNSISKIDFHTLTKLKALVCYGNPLTDVNLNNCKDVETLNILAVGINAVVFPDGKKGVHIGDWEQTDDFTFSMTNAGICGIHIHNSDVIRRLDLSDNDALSVQAYGNSALSELLIPSSTVSLGIYDDTVLESVDVSSCGELEKLIANNSALNTLDVSRNVVLKELEAGTNHLSSIDLANNTALSKLVLSHNGITAINVQKNTELLHLDLGENNLSAVNVRYNTKLEYLSTAGNAAITTINVKNNPALKTLAVSKNSITELDVTANTNLERLDIGSTLITELDLSENSLLDFIDISDTPFKKSLKVGDYVCLGKSDGIVFQTTENVVKMVSMDETVSQWGYDGIRVEAYDEADGFANTQKIPDSPAAQWCTSKGSNWYLPASKEGKDMVMVISVINPVIVSCGGTEFDCNRFYWSSTASTNNSSYACYYSHYLSTERRAGNERVRAVCAL